MRDFRQQRDDPEGEMGTRVRKWGTALTVLAAGMLYGTTGTAQALAPVGTDPSSIGLVRIALGGLALLPFAAAREGGLRALARGLSPWVLLAGAGLAGFQVLFFRGVIAAGVALGTVVAIASGPVFAGILGAVVFRERLSPAWWASTALAVLGCALVSRGKSAAPAPDAGIALALGAGASYAVLGLGIKKASRRLTSLGSVTLGLLTGSLLLVPVFLASGASIGWTLSPRGFLTTAHLGLLTTAVPYFLFARALGILPMGWVYTLGLSEPLVAALLGILLLRETPSPGALWGIALMTGALGVSGAAASGNRINGSKEGSSGITTENTERTEANEAGL